MYIYMCIDMCIYAIYSLAYISPKMNLNCKSSPLNHEHVFILITVTSLCGTTLHRKN